MSLPRAFTALSGATAVSMLAQILRGKLAALFLGPAGVGVFNQLSLMWNLFQLGGGLGSFNGIVQHGAEALAGEDRAALRRLVSTSTLLLGTAACLLAATGVVLAASISNLLLHDSGQHAWLVRLLMLAVPFGVTAQTYRALLSSARAVPQLVRTQIFSDVASAFLFAALIVPLGLTGAILGFMATHVLLFAAGLVSADRVLGGRVITPRASDFCWSVVRSNVGFSASGLLLTALTNISVLIVGRLIIDHVGMAGNGIFSNAWRIASVYLGGVTAATIGYYVPTLTRCEDNAAITREVNSALRFYLCALPLLMVAIMAGGELIVRLILSREFLVVAPLLLVFVPAELVRIVGDCVVAPYLAKRRIRSFTMLNFLAWSTFVAFSLAIVPVAGMIGGAFAYLAAMLIGTVAMYFRARRDFDFRTDRATRAAGFWAVLLLAGVVCVCATYPIGTVRFAVITVIALAWAFLTFRAPHVRSAIRSFFDKSFDARI